MTMRIIEHYEQKWLNKIGFAGFAVGNHIFYSDANPPNTLIAHEKQHVFQYRALSPFNIMLIGIIIYAIRWWAELLMGIVCYRSLYLAYSKISFEIEATSAEEVLLCERSEYIG